MALSYGPWRIKREKQRQAIRFTLVRFVKRDDGTESTERLPVEKYASIRDNPEELQKLCDRLNYDLSKVKLAKEKVKWKHAFIDDELLEEFRGLLSAQIPTKDRVSCNMYYLKHYFLNYFIHELGLANPREWYQVQATKWSMFLQGPKVPKAASTKRDIIQIANRFMKWLHGKRPDEVALFIFEPLSMSVLKKIDADRKMNKEDANRKNILDADWKKIKPRLPDSIRSAALIAYHYGLRRSEVLGLKPGDVKKGHVSAVRQLVALRPAPTFGPLKGRESRRIPHWFGSAIEAHKWITELQSLLMHPDTLSDRWLEFMSTLGMTYDFHDLRHTFITKALSTKMPKEVMLAAGHKKIETTMGYSHDDRDLDNEEFDPEAA